MEKIASLGMCGQSLRDRERERERERERFFLAMRGVPTYLGSL